MDRNNQQNMYRTAGTRLQHSSNSNHLYKYNQDHNPNMILEMEALQAVHSKGRTEQYPTTKHPQ